MVAYVARERDMISTYFKSNGRLIRCQINSDSIGIAQVETYLLAVEEGATPDTTVLAVVPNDERPQ